MSYMLALGMRVLLPILIVLTLSIGISQGAFAQQAQPQGVLEDGACTSNGTGGGPWSDPNSWDCVGILNDVPASRKAVTILAGDTITVDRDLNRTSGDATTFIGNVAVSGTLEVPSGFTFKADQLENFSSVTVNNFGNMIIAEFFNNGLFNNNCGATLKIIELFTNTGGLRGPFGSNNQIFNNFGIFELGPGFDIPDEFVNTNTFNDGGFLINVFETGPQDNFGPQAIIEINSICLVGGDLIPLDTTSLLLAGAQMTASWMIPVIVSGIGIAIVIARRF